MTAVEVLEWLIEHYSDGEYRKAFGENYTWYDFTIYEITPQEIVDRIEKYETEKNRVEIESKSKEHDFKVGDWVLFKNIKYEVMQTCTLKGELGLSEVCRMNDKCVKLNEVLQILADTVCTYESTCRNQRCVENPSDCDCSHYFLDGNNIHKELFRLDTVELPQWHDLRKNPDDLPTKYGEYLVKMVCNKDNAVRIKLARFDSNGWHFPIFIDHTVIAEYIKWCELPKDDD